MLKVNEITHPICAYLLLFSVLLVAAGCGGGGGGGGGGVVNGSASLSWSPPTTRMDGSALYDSDIVSYNVHYGTTSSGPYPNVINVPKSACNPSCESVITGLSSGTYYFVVTVIDTLDVQSGYSVEQSKTI